ncbi:hypothetical protein [Streptosporangium sp. NPDC002721]
MNDDITREDMEPDFVFEAIVDADGQEITDRACCGGGRCGRDDPDG